MRSTKDEFFLSLLAPLEARGTCARRKVAAIITDKDGHVLSMGYNGPPVGVEHCTEVPCAGVDEPKGSFNLCEAVHAEVSCLLQCSALRFAHTIYCSCVPCFGCMKAIMNTPVRRVVCRDDYPDHTGLELFCRRAKTDWQSLADGKARYELFIAGTKVL